jgi:hypothetical protein
MNLNRIDTDEGSGNGGGLLLLRGGGGRGDKGAGKTRIRSVS